MKICILLLFCLLCRTINASDSDITQVIHDVIAREKTPTQLTVFNNCWSFGRSENLIRTLMLPINFHDDTTHLPKQVFHDKQHVLVLIIDLNCNGSAEFLNMIHPKYFAHPYRWILISDQDVAIDLLVDKPVSVDNNIILISRDPNRFKLQQFFKPGKDSTSMIWESYGTWDSQNRLTDLRSSHILSRRRLNIRQSPLASSLVIRNEDTVNHLHDYRDRHVDSVTKFTFQMIDITMRVMNASTTYHYVPIWGYLNQTTQKYSGMMGDLVDGVSDIGGTMLFMTTNRIPIIDYFCVQSPSSVQFIFRQPALSTVSNIYIMPFTNSVWYCAALLILVCSIAIYLTIVFTNRQNICQSTPVDRQENRFTDVLLLAIGAVCQMGSHFEPKIVSGKISSLFLFVAFLFLYTSYTANIVALLQSTSNNIRSLQDMMNARFEFGVEDNSYNRYYFKSETEPVRKLIYDTKIAPTDNFMNTTVGLEKIRRGLFAFNTEVGPAYKFIEDTFYDHEKCGLTEIKFIQVAEVCLALQKNSPYKEMLKVNIFKLRENGLVDREQRKIYTPKPKCDKHGQSFQSIGLTDCHLIIMIIVYGHVLAVIIFGIEKFMHSRRRLKGVCSI